MPATCGSGHFRTMSRSDMNIAGRRALPPEGGRHIASELPPGRTALGAVVVGRAAALLPGFGLCVGIAVLASLVQAAEERATGHPYVEALVIAILGGTLVRTVWTPGTRFRSRIEFSGRTVLESAVMLLGLGLIWALRIP